MGVMPRGRCSTCKQGRLDPSRRPKYPSLLSVDRQCTQFPENLNQQEGPTGIFIDPLLQLPHQGCRAQVRPASAVCVMCTTPQVVEDGYQFFAKRQLITIFSAPNYCGEFDNSGAMMSVDETLMCSFQILKPAVKKPRFLN